MQSKQTIQVGPLTMTLGPAEEAADFAARLRNPLERGVQFMSDGLQSGLAFLGSLLPETGWAPPKGWDKDL